MVTPGPLALIGSGEHDPAMGEVLDWLMQTRPARIVHVGVVAGFDGARSLAAWQDQAQRTADTLGAELVPVGIRTGDDAASAAADVDGAGLVLLSGESSGYLSQTLAGTAVWRAVLAAWAAGAALAAAGPAAMAMGGVVPQVRPRPSGSSRGLGVVPALRLVPDIDGLGPSLPDSVLAPLADPTATVVGLDRATALVGEPDADGGAWAFRARGRGSAWLIRREGRRRVLAPLRLDVVGRS